MATGIDGEILRLFRSGNSTVRGIADALGGKVGKTKVAEVLAEARRAAAAEAAAPTSEKARPGKRVAARAPAASSPAPAPAPAPSAAARAEDMHAEAVDALHDADRAHLRLDRVHGALVTQLEHELDAVKLPTKCAKCGEAFTPQPNWTSIQKLTALSLDLGQQLAKTRPPVQRKPEEDPANIEAARVVVSSLRARVEAHHARAAAPAPA